MSLPDIETVEIVLTNVKGYFKRNYSCSHTGYKVYQDTCPNFTINPAYNIEVSKLMKSADPEYLNELRKVEPRFNPILIQAVKNVNSILESDDPNMLLKQIEFIENKLGTHNFWGTYYIDRIPANLPTWYYKIKYDELHCMEYIEYDYNEIASSMQHNEIELKFRLKNGYTTDEIKKDSDVYTYMATKNVNRMKYRMKNNMNIMNPQ